MNEPPEGAIMLKKPRDVKKKRLFDLPLVCYAYFFYANLSSIGAFYTYFTYMASRGDTGAVPTPIPEDDDGQRMFPAGYKTSQLLFAWNWGLNSDALGSDESAAANVGSSIFYICIVVAQMGHLISIRRKTPYFFDAIMNTDTCKKLTREVVYGSSNNPTKTLQDDQNNDAAIHTPDRNVLLRMWDEISHSEIQFPIIAAWCGSILTVNFFNYVPIFQDYCGTAAVPGRFWGIAIGWSVLWFTVAEIRKWLIFLFPESTFAKAVAW